MFRHTRTLLRVVAPVTKSASTSRIPTFSPRLVAPIKFYSTQGGAQESAATTEDALNHEGATKDSSSASATTELDQKIEDLTKQLEDKSKQLAELKDARLRTLADFENLQKISQREKTQAKDFALTSFAKDLVRSIDIVSLALKSVPVESLQQESEGHNLLKQLHEGVSLTKKEIETVLKRHGVTAFDPTGEQFDPNRHEALFQAPVPGKEPGSVLECQEIGWMIKDRLLRPAKVGVVLAQD